MFLSETHLPQLLSADAYRNPEIAQREAASLFLPGWHCVACVDDLSEPGAFLSRELLGHPIIVWRDGESVHAFLNVCAHRFSLLTDQPSGVMPSLKCRYHGWEYDANGDTKKIPDAKSFKPLQRGQLGLTRLPCQRVGQLIFVSLSDSPLPLQEYLGPAFDLCRKWFGEDTKLVLAARRSNHCNWKVSVENSLESYHLTEVHSATFGGHPDADFCRHRLYDDSHSELRVDRSSDFWLVRLARRLERFTGMRVETDYHQVHRYPNLVFAKFGPFRWMEAVYPLSASDSYDTWRFFSGGVSRQTLRGRLIHRILRLWGRRWFQRVIDEDEAIFPSIQHGLESPTLPGTGLISMREERVHHFQRYVHQNQNNEPPRLVASPTARTCHDPSCG